MTNENLSHRYALERIGALSEVIYLRAQENAKRLEVIEAAAYYAKESVELIEKWGYEISGLVDELLAKED